MGAALTQRAVLPDAVGEQLPLLVQHKHGPLPADQRLDVSLGSERGLWRVGCARGERQVEIVELLSV